MNEQQLEPLLVVGRDALSQALRQWEMHSNDARAALDYHDLGKGDDMEDRAYRYGKGALKRLGAAADEIEDARLARRTAFDSSAWLASVHSNSDDVSDRERSGGSGAGGVRKTNTPRTDSIPRRGPFHHYVVDDVLFVAKKLERELAVAEAKAHCCNGDFACGGTCWVCQRITEAVGHAERAGEEWKAEAMAGRDRISWLEQQREIALNQCAAAEVERDGADKVCANLRKEIAGIADYLWPNQTGLPNEHRNALVAIQTREKLLKAQYEGALIREASCREIIAKMDAQQITDEEHLEQMTMAANQLHKELSRAEHLIAKAMKWGLNTQGYDAEKARITGDELREFMEGRAAAAGEWPKPSPGREATKNYEYRRDINARLVGCSAWLGESGGEGWGGPPPHEPKHPWRAVESGIRPLHARGWPANDEARGIQ